MPTLGACQPLRRTTLPVLRTTPRRVPLLSPRHERLASQEEDSRGENVSSARRGRPLLNSTSISNEPPQKLGRSPLPRHRPPSPVTCTPQRALVPYGVRRTVRCDPSQPDQPFLFGEKVNQICTTHAVLRCLRGPHQQQAMKPHTSSPSRNGNPVFTLLWWFHVSVSRYVVVPLSLFRLCGGFSLHSLVFDGPCVSVYYLDGGDEPSPRHENKREGALLKNLSGDFPPLSFVVLSCGSPLLSPSYFFKVDTFLFFFFLWHFSPTGRLSLSLVVASLPLATTWWIPSLSRCFVAVPFVLFLRWFRSLLFFVVFLCFSLSLSLSFLRGSSSPLSVCGCPSRSLLLPWLRSLLFFAVVLSFLSLFGSCVLCLFCMKEAGTTTGKRENPFFFGGPLLQFFRVLVLLPPLRFVV